MVSRVGATAADELGVPSIINMPAGPLKFFQEIGLGWVFPNMHEKAVNWMGQIVIR